MNSLAIGRGLEHNKFLIFHVNICGYFCVSVNDDLMYFHFVQNSSTNSTESLGSLNIEVS